MALEREALIVERKNSLGNVMSRRFKLEGEKENKGYRFSLIERCEIFSKPSSLTLLFVAGIFSTSIKPAFA